MHCGRCNNDLGKCTCADIDERMASMATPNSAIVFKMCSICNKHYARCKCNSPVWVRSDTRTPLATEPENT